MVERVRSIGVMFVCLGNICRSPMAEAVFQNLVDETGLGKNFRVASSAVGNWHEGERPHPGTQAVLKQKMVPLNPEKRAIPFKASDTKQYQYILALDQEIVSNIQYMYGIRLKRLMEYASPGSPLDVPDPYYNHRFELVYDLVAVGCKGLLAAIIKTEGI